MKVLRDEGVDETFCHLYQLCRAPLCVILWFWPMPVLSERHYITYDQTVNLSDTRQPERSPCKMTVTLAL